MYPLSVISARRRLAEVNRTVELGVLVNRKIELGVFLLFSLLLYLVSKCSTASLSYYTLATSNIIASSSFA